MEHLKWWIAIVVFRHQAIGPKSLWLQKQLDCRLNVMDNLMSVIPIDCNLWMTLRAARLLGLFRCCCATEQSSKQRWVGGCNIVWAGFCLGSPGTFYSHHEHLSWWYPFIYIHIRHSRPSCQQLRPLKWLLGKLWKLWFTVQLQSVHHF